MRRKLNLLVASLLLGIVVPVAAQSDKPPNLEAVPEPPPPPPGLSDDTAEEPQVTIKKRGEDKIEEFRMHGKLYMIRVTPPHGRSYYLIDDRGTGEFSKRDDLDNPVRVPMWVIKQF